MQPQRELRQRQAGGGRCAGGELHSGTREKSDDIPGRGYFVRLLVEFPP